MCCRPTGGYDENTAPRFAAESFFRQVDREEASFTCCGQIFETDGSSVVSFALTLKRQLADVDSLLAQIDAHEPTVEEIPSKTWTWTIPLESLLVGAR